HCGARVGAAKSDSVSKSSEVRPETIVASMVALFVFGLVAISGLIGTMRVILELNNRQILGFAGLSFLLMLILEGVFIRLLFHRTRGAKDASDAVPLAGQATKGLDPAQARALPEAVPSVTEHTTRSFDPIYGEQRSE